MTLRLLIGIPSHDKWVPQFGLSLAGLCVHLSTVSVAGEGVDWEVAMIQGSVLSEGREQLVGMARSSDRDLLFLDTDMSFPKDTAHLLYTTGRDIIGANCVTKSLPATPTARRTMPGSSFGEPVYTDPDSVGVELVDHLGLAVTLIRHKVLAATEPPLFEIRWNPATGSYRGEDWAFFQQLKAQNIQPAIHHGLSRQVGHWGSLEYGHEMVGEVRQSDVA